MKKYNIIHEYGEVLKKEYAHFVKTNQKSKICWDYHLIILIS